VGAAEAFDADVGVDLSGGDVGVAEHFLDGAEVGTVVEEMGRKGVAEHVRGDILTDVGGSGAAFDDLPHTGPAHAPTAC